MWSGGAVDQIEWRRRIQHLRGAERDCKQLDDASQKKKGLSSNMFNSVTTRTIMSFCFHVVPNICIFSVLVLTWLLHKECAHSSLSTMEGQFEP